MRKRAEQVEGTRQRITEAAMRLHTTIGPAQVSLSAIADEAGVTRLTLYRHFASADELFAACMGHWRLLNQPPDPEAWRAIASFEARLRHALGELFGWYREHGDELYPIFRDWEAMPDTTLRQMEANDTQMVAALMDGVAGDGDRDRRRRAALGHVVAFWTWRSLAVQQGLADAEAVDLAVGLVLAA
jgi:AcrR family transcriptional regulator